MGLNEAAGYGAVALTSLAAGYLAAEHGLRPAPFLLGLSYTADDVARWNRDAEAFYPLQRPGVDNAAVKVKAAPSATPTARYDVTVPSSVATGETSRSAAESPAPESTEAVPTGSVPTGSVPTPTSGTPSESTESDSAESDSGESDSGESVAPATSEPGPGSESEASESAHSDEPTSDESASDDGEDSSPDSGSDSSEG